MLFKALRLLTVTNIPTVTVTHKLVDNTTALMERLHIHLNTRNHKSSLYKSLCHLTISLEDSQKKIFQVTLILRVIFKFCTTNYLFE